MDATHLHLILTHFPIVGTIIGIVILAYGKYAKNNEIKKVALTTFVFMAILTIPVYLTGEESEETVEHLAGVSEKIIERHEELAEGAILLMSCLGILSLISLIAIVKKLSFAKIATILTFAVSLVTFAVFVQVGNLGGQIRHSEIQTENINNLKDVQYPKGNENDKELLERKRGHDEEHGDDSDDD